jgi:oxygen-independent coproporphyrinogen-3 oxidase
MGYTTKAGTDLMGMGMSAIGGVAGRFIQNQRDLKGYQAAMDKGGPATMRGFRLSDDDKLRARVIQNLLCHATVDKRALEREFKIDFDAYFAASLTALAPLAADGLVEITADHVRPTATGRFFLRNLAMPFDAYLPKPGDRPIFSRTV